MKECELCRSAARMYCESDQASLCWNCDAKVHGANFLVARHTRCLLCHACQAPTPWKASGPKLGRTVSVCDRCVVDRCGGITTEEQEPTRSGSNHLEDVYDDDDDDDDEEEEEDAEEDEDEVDVEDEADNQVVPWSSATPPPPSACSSSSEDSSTGLSNAYTDESEPKRVSAKRPHRTASNLAFQVLIFSPNVCRSDRVFQFHCFNRIDSVFIVIKWVA